MDVKDYKSENQIQLEAYFRNPTSVVIYYLANDKDPDIMDEDNDDKWW